MYRSPKYWKEMARARKEHEAQMKREAERQAPSAKQEVTSYKLPGPRPISNANKGLIHRRQASSAKLLKK